MLAVQAFLLLCLGFGLFYFFRKKNYKSPPGPYGLPFFGSSFFIRDAQYKVFQRWAQKYGPIVKLKIGSDDVLILDDSQVIREALADPAFSGRGDSKVLSIISGGKYGITSNEGAAWVEQRRFVLKELRDFGFGKASMESIILPEVQDFLSWIRTNRGNPIPVNKRLTLATLNTLWAIVAGERNDQADTTLCDLIYRADEGLQELARTSHLVLFPKLIDILPSRWLGPWNRAKAGMEGLTKVFNDAVQDHIRNPVSADSPRDLIDVYLAAIQRTTDTTSSFYGAQGHKSLVAVVGDLFAAGAGASSETITWAILYLILHPRVQQKARLEIDNIVGRNRLPSIPDMETMPYCEALINEVLRLSSVAPTAFHYTTQNTKLRGFDVQKNTTVISNFYSVHHSIQIWGDPESFRPERFLSPDGQTVLKSDHLMPFGTGRRQCIGERLARTNAFLFLASLLQEFQLCPDPAYPRPSAEPIPGFILEPQEFKVVFKERD